MTDSTGLYHFGARYYDPNAGRWTQPYPLDQTGGLREGNRYVYVGGDPVNLTDPTGMHIGDDLWDAGETVVRGGAALSRASTEVRGGSTAGGGTPRTSAGRRKESRLREPSL